MAQKTSKRVIERIREEVCNGKSKYRVAVEMNLSFSLVYRHTKDLPCINNREPCVRGKAFIALKQLLHEGYIHSDKETGPALRRLRYFFPMIQRSQIEGKGIYYLNDKNKKALQSFMEQKHSRVISYLDLANISRTFDVRLTKNEKQHFLGKSKPKKSY